MISSVEAIEKGISLLAATPHTTTTTTPPADDGDPGNESIGVSDEVIITILDP